MLHQNAYQVFRYVAVDLGFGIWGGFLEFREFEVPNLRERALLRVSLFLFLKEEVLTLGPERRLGSSSSRFGRRTWGFGGRRPRTHQLSSLEFLFPSFLMFYHDFMLYQTSNIF